MRKKNNSRFVFLFIIFIIININYNSLAYNESENIYNYFPHDTSNYSKLQNPAFEGYTLYAPEWSQRTFLINNSGEVVNMWESHNFQALGTYLCENGDLIRNCLYWLNPYFPLQRGMTGLVEKFDWNGTLIWEFEYSNNDFCLHHDIKPLPNGNILMIAWEYKNYDDAIAAGKNQSKIEGNVLYTDYIIEVEPTYPYGGNIVWEWHAWDHIIQDYDSNQNNFGIVNENPELIDINFGEKRDELFHINSIDYNLQLDQILLSVAYYNEIWIVDHSISTNEAKGHEGGRYGMGGDLLYRWGNPQTYQQGGDENQKLFYQHDANWIESGIPGEDNILIFNNGLNRPEGSYSSIEEIIPPLNYEGKYDINSNGKYGPDETIWSYNSIDLTDFYSDKLSGAQRLPNGNTLICEGIKGYFFEISPDKQVVWDYLIPYPEINKQVFKIRRYSPNFSGLGEFRYQTPYQPAKINGSKIGKTGIEYYYSSSCIDPNDDDLFYLFDWGDNSNSKWIGPYKSGEYVTTSHVWKEPNYYEIRVKSKDVNNLESIWSDPLYVEIEGNQVLLFGSIESKISKDNEICFYADKLLLIKFSPFGLNIYNEGIYVCIDIDYSGILTDNFIIGKFYLKEIF